MNDPSEEILQQKENTFADNDNRTPATGLSLRRGRITADIRIMWASLKNARAVWCTPLRATSTTTAPRDVTMQAIPASSGMACRHIKRSRLPM